MRNRESGLDVLRCMALFFVNGVHSFNYNGYYTLPQEGEWMWVANCLRWLCFGCIGIFLMLTGYLKSQKPLSKGYYFGLVPVLLGYVLTCVISFPIRHYLLGDQLTLKEWIEKMLTFGNYAWYVEMYIGLLLVSPVLNLALSQLRTTGQLLWAAGIAFFVTALPALGFKNHLPDYWIQLYPFTYYVLGAVIRRLQPRLKLWQGLPLIALWVGIIGWLAMRYKAEGFDQGYGGFWVTVMVVLIFLTFYRVQLKPVAAKVVGWLAGGCFEGYILSRLLDVWVYDKVPQWHMPSRYLLIFLCVTLPVCLISMLMGKATHSLVELLMKPLRKKSAIPEKV